MKTFKILPEADVGNAGEQPTRNRAICEKGFYPYQCLATAQENKL